MSLSGNIAKYRKQKGYTQEQLGEKLGVTNQTVSKWESAVCSPDVMILPKIADTLDITLEQLYGIEKNQSNKTVKLCDFYKNASETLIGLLYDQLGEWILFPEVNPENNPKLVEAAKNPQTNKIDQIKNNKSFELFSDTSGFAYISDDLSMIDSKGKIINNGDVFKDRETLLALKKISNTNVNKIMEYMYAKVFKDKELYRSNSLNVEIEFLFDEIVEKCHLEEDEALAGLDKLSSLNILKKSAEDNTVKYILYKSKVVQYTVLLKMIERLVRETNAWGWGGPDMIVCNHIE